MLGTGKNVTAQLNGEFVVCEGYHSLSLFAITAYIHQTRFLDIGVLIIKVHYLSLTITRLQGNKSYCHKHVKLTIEIVVPIKHLLAYYKCQSSHHKNFLVGQCLCDSLMQGEIADLTRDA